MRLVSQLAPPPVKSLAVSQIHSAFSFLCAFFHVDFFLFFFCTRDVRHKQNAPTMMIFNYPPFKKRSLSNISAFPQVLDILGVPPKNVYI